MSRHDHDLANEKPLTRLVRSGRDHSITGPFVNPPVVHASTVLFETADDLLSGKQRYTYGRRGTPTIEALEDAISELEGAEGSVLCPSGLNAVSTALLSVLRSGDHLLMADNVYDPARTVATSVLERMGVETTFFDPTIGSAISSLFRANTRAVYLESPGSLTFEISDVPAIVAVARAHDAYVLADNTWATPYFFKPLAHGVDLSIQAGTKYLCGHSDVMIGTVAANARTLPLLKDTHSHLGLCVGPDDIYLTLRGMRTMGIRLERQQSSALTVARWLSERGEVDRVLHPGLTSHPGHAIWKRDMTGSSGLFGIVTRDWSLDKVKAFLDGLRLFGLGFSWGGYESLAVIGRPRRTAKAWPAGDHIIRLQIGLEDTADLIQDLEESFARVSNLS
ncbi:cystathionine beta-lyase [Kaistia sp. 32K]|uniref:cystathionine beta-lyase n=1 Tax=Kaistia sp. 32K TaxID=2795690 RepID=UPI0019151542|nr:cystathionine beta-lyase [Kaistia sp. 32K]BCP53401.1 cystathionine beta-lyase [Kaistia sp. 32K]